LGSGNEDSPLSLKALKEHEFFEGKDFKSVNLGVMIEMIKKIKRYRNNLSDHLFEAPSYSNPGYEYTNIDTPRKVEEAKVLKEGSLNKKFGWVFYHNRRLVLTSQPRLSYYLPMNNGYKVTFSW
jgi:hypothetical protein